MRNVRVTLVTPDGMPLQNTELPDDMKVEEVIAELKDELNLPETNENNEKIIYSLSIENRRQILQTGRTLRESGVEDGDTIRMSSSQPAPARESVPPAALAERSRPDASEIEVLVSGLDLNKTEKMRLQADLRVSQLIQQIVAQNTMMSKNGDSNGSYQLKSKHLGGYLLPSQTLGEAGIPNLDRLVLIKHDTAGGGYAR